MAVVSTLTTISDRYLLLLLFIARAFVEKICLLDAFCSFAHSVLMQPSVVPADVQSLVSDFAQYTLIMDVLSSVCGISMNARYRKSVEVL